MSGVKSQGKKRKGRRPLPDDLRRELVSVRILPITRKLLEAMEYENLGRAIDALTAAAFELDEAKAS